MSALQLRLPESASQRRRSPWQLTYVRDIGPEELVLLHSSSNLPSDPKAPLARLRDPHHTLAQMLANGDDPIIVSRVTGYSTARIRTLIRDPAFAELMAFYAEQKVHRDRDIDLSIRHVAMAASAELQERLDDTPEAFSNEELRKLRNDSLDRVGYGPQSKKTIEIHDPKAVLAELRALVSGERRAVVVARDEIEADYTEVLDVEESSSTDQAPIG